jgi:hypothetical protein
MRSKHQMRGELSISKESSRKKDAQQTSNDITSPVTFFVSSATILFTMNYQKRILTVLAVVLCVLPLVSANPVSRQGLEIGFETIGKSHVCPLNSSKYHHH